MNVRYRVELSQAERDQLTAMLRGGRHAARKLKRAQILMAADNGATDAAIAASVAVGESTVYRTKRRFVEGNLDLALSEDRARRRLASCRARTRRFWLLPLAPARRRGAHAGHLSCWLTR